MDQRDAEGKVYTTPIFLRLSPFLRIETQPAHEADGSQPAITNERGNVDSIIGQHPAWTISLAVPKQYSWSFLRWCLHPGGTTSGSGWY